MSILANQNAIAIPELNGAKIRKTEDGRFSVYDLIRIAGGQKNPHQPWKRLQEAYPELVTKCEFYKFQGKDAIIPLWQLLKTVFTLFQT